MKRAKNAKPQNAGHVQRRNESIPQDKGSIASYAGDLKDNQSVRTSFRLSREGGEALVWLARDADVKFHGVLTHIAGSLLADKARRDEAGAGETLLTRVMDAALNMDTKARDASVRKTYVINRFVLNIFNSLAKSSNIPRDLVVDLALKIKRADREAEAETRRSGYENALKSIRELWAEAEKMEKRLMATLDEGDPVLNRFGIGIVVLMNLCSSIEANLKNGTPVDPDDISQSD